LQQLEPTLVETIQATKEQLMSNQAVCLQLLRHVHMLLGITQGMTSAEDFKIYFNWLRPNCF